jgi:hypothetical protein
VQVAVVLERGEAVLAVLAIGGEAVRRLPVHQDVHLPFARDLNSNRCRAG